MNQIPSTVFAGLVGRADCIRISLCIAILVLGTVGAVSLFADEALAAPGQAQKRLGCDPHYVSQTCVPIAKDVDCADGGGNGPAYVAGPFEYVGEDIYGLDRNHDGVACEPKPSR